MNPNCNCCPDEYGIGGVTDAILRCIADRRDLTDKQLSHIIHRNAPVDSTDPPTGIYDWLDLYAWDMIIGPAIDSIERRIFPED